MSDEMSGMGWDVEVDERVYEVQFTHSIVCRAEQLRLYSRLP